MLVSIMKTSKLMKCQKEAIFDSMNDNENVITAILTIQTTYNLVPNTINVHTVRTMAQPNGYLSTFPV